MHQVTVDPVVWRPTTTLSKFGTVVRALASSCARCLRGSEASGRPPTGILGPEGALNSPLPLLSASDIRFVSRRFSRRTAVGLGGFLVRHYSYMSDGALEAPAQIFVLIETSGFFPRRLRALIVALLAKPTSGFRPVGVFGGPRRLRAKSRRRIALQWEATRERPYWAAGFF